MTIKFRCQHCHKTVKAPDSAAGQRGKCPYCGLSSYIPAPVGDDEILPLAPVDEEFERKREEETRRLIEQDPAVVEGGSGEEVPLEDRDDVGPEDVRHLVVNYCMDMGDGNLERAKRHASRLRQFPYAARQAVDELLKKETLEPALDSIPQKVLTGFLNQLREQLGSD
jgi:NAD-dependent SIR2 family protein deacetylase